MEQLEVIASFDWLEKEETIGVLNYENLRGSDVFSFEFSDEWLKNHPDIFLGHDLQQFTGIQYSQSGKGIFGCFADALPDRWGRRLINLRDEMLRRDSGLARRNLSDWDYLKGVEDIQRMGGFRFKNQSGSYLNADETYQVPPILSLNKLLEASNEVEKSYSKHEDPEVRWIQRLFRPGSSVGGARPKACVTDRGVLYIAKFPSIKDDIDVSRWEHFAHKMAKECGIKVAETKLIKTDSGHDVLLSRRFDRNDKGRRIHMASSLSLLGLTDGSGQESGNGYLDIVDFIVSNGCDTNVNLEELYKRVAFNIVIGNSDDHFRNHSFLLTKKGWGLSPAYDMNPTLNRHQSLLIDEYSNEANLDVLFEAHKSYLLDEDTAWGIIKDITRNMKYWESMARDCGINRKEIDVFSERINVGLQWKYGEGGLKK